MSDYSQKSTNTFSSTYIAIRRSENRVYTDEQVKVLPHLSMGNRQDKEWKQRASTANRFGQYLKNMNKSLSILEIGCGNGWFSNYLSELNNTTVLGIDINTHELEQAKRVFNKKNLSFQHHNILDKPLAINNIDIIIFNASIQYFSDLHQLFNTLNPLLDSNGEIHLIDSPFYSRREVLDAKKRSQEYYNKAGYAEMNNYYFHHCWEDLPNHEIINQPKYNSIKQLFGYYNTPFSWIKINRKT